MIQTGYAIHDSGETGERIILKVCSAETRLWFASTHETSIIDDIMAGAFGIAPLAGKLVLLNKLPGEDKTDEMLVDGNRFWNLKLRRIFKY